MIVSGATSSGAPSHPMSPVAMASVVAGSAIFLALMALVAHASYRRKKEYDWHVAEWRRAEEEARTQKERHDREEMLH
jgi:hypothetical protein